MLPYLILGVLRPFGYFWDSLEDCLVRGLPRNYLLHTIIIEQTDEVQDDCLKNDILAYSNHSTGPAKTRPVAGQL
jgi:hypothetical protein